jgi:hypothetical protein
MADSRVLLSEHPFFAANQLTAALKMRTAQRGPPHSRRPTGQRRAGHEDEYRD